MKDQEKFASWLHKQDDELRKVTKYGKIIWMPNWIIHKYFLNGNPVSEQLQNKLFQKWKVKHETLSNNL